MKDLIILVADKNMEYTLRGILSRPKALEIRSNVTWDIFVHPNRDPGCLLKGHEFLKPHLQAYLYAMIMFDREGCGKENLSAQELKNEVQTQLKPEWGSRSEVIVLDPELDVWVFSNSPHVIQIIADKDKNIYYEVLSKYEKTAIGKPSRPKEAMEEILKKKKIPRSSAIYKQLAEKVSLSKCQDPSFNQFRMILQKWFPQNT